MRSNNKGWLATVLPWAVVLTIVTLVISFAAVRTQNHHTWSPVGWVFHFYKREQPRKTWDVWLMESDTDDRRMHYFFIADPAVAAKLQHARQSGLAVKLQYDTNIVERSVRPKPVCEIVDIITITHP